jgi:hypothetical protein
MPKFDARKAERVLLSTTVTALSLIFVILYLYMYCILLIYLLSILSNVA